MATNWMARLAAHYDAMRSKYPEDKLLILFDLDGCIVDMRYMMLHVLWAYDQAHETRYFRRLRLADINVHENQADQLLATLPISPEEQAEVLAWYKEQRWSSAVILEAHRPYSGVLEVIRWFQIQPDTYVGVDTGRPESIRADTLRSLNKLGKEYRIQFSDEFLFMNAGDWEENVVQSKVAGVRHFQKAGYRIFAFVENEPANLNAVAEYDTGREILLLHADTFFESKRITLPANSASGDMYDLTELIPEKALPQHVEFVWHGVNDEPNLRQFLGSNVKWAECDVHLDPTGSELILRHDNFAENPLAENEEWLMLDRLLEVLHERGRHLKLDLKAGGAVVDKVLALVNDIGFSDECLWFNGNVERLQEHRIRQLAAARPGAIIQCPVDFLAPLICSAVQKACEILEMLSDWGVNRFSISWLTRDMREFLEQMDQWGYEVNIYNVPDLEAFLQAVLLTPRSVTSDFNFPKWYYYGHGSGARGEQYEYAMRRVTRDQR